MDQLKQNKEPRMKGLDMALIILGILFISFNLRAPITAIGTIGQSIQAEYGLSDAVSGLITTIPLIAFAVVSPFVAKVSKEIGHSLTMMIGLVFILIGLIIRSYAGVVGLFLGTAIIGVGIAIGNVIIPAIIKLYFSDKVGVVTSVYTTGMCTFAAVGAGVSVPLQNVFDSWHHSLACWIGLVLLTMIIWVPQLLKKNNNGVSQSTNNNVLISQNKHTSIWRSRLAWWVTLYMGTQSLIFYTLTHWLAPIILYKGFDQEFASGMALTFQLMAIPATLIMPMLTGKFKDQRLLVLLSCIVYAVGMVCLMFGSNMATMVVAVVFMSLAMGASISLSIAFISLRSPNPMRTSELSGMSQSAGYLIAAVGPLLIGLIFDTHTSYSVTLGIGILLALIVFLAIVGMFAGTNKTCEE